MPVIYLETFINAPQQLVFDLGRNVDVHMSSMKHHHEEVIDGVSKGLMQKGDVVAWQAKHLLKTRTLRVRITELKEPEFFIDEMLKGDFKKMRHKHYFRKEGDGTLMIDKFYFESPFGLAGKFVNWLFLKNYMRKLLVQRNKEIKRVAESKKTIPKYKEHD